MTTKQHIAGPLIGHVQMCIRCDAALADYRGPGLADVPSGSSTTSILGWACGGAVYELETGDWSAFVPPSLRWESCLAVSQEGR